MANKKHGKQSKCKKRSAKSKCIQNLLLSRYKKTEKINNEDNTNNLEEDMDIQKSNET